MIPGNTHRNCPVCDSSKRTVLHRQQFWDGPLGDGYDVVVCDECGCGFADGIPSQEEMDRYYAEQSKYAYEHRNGLESPWDFDRFRTTVAHLTPFLKSSSAKILDIGCATGGLLSVFKGAGYTNLFGVDPSPVCSETAARLYGVNATAANVSGLEEWAERFDLILMLGVLEHLGEPGQSIRIARSLLNPGGRLYCAVPDVEGLVGCPNAPYQQFSFEHFNFFSIKSLNNLQSVNGLAPVNNWRWTTEWREGVMEPIASGLFECSEVGAPSFDTSTQAALKAYIEVSAREDMDLFATIDSLRKSRQPILVWGTGTLARRLLASGRLSETNIVAFIDSSPQSQGKLLAGRSVLSPEQVSNRSESILICSRPFRMEIIATIRALGLSNDVIPFATETLESNAPK
jgi:SAM-dependent methyltransferase